MEAPTEPTEFKEEIVPKPEDDPTDKSETIDLNKIVREGQLREAEATPKIESESPLLAAIEFTELPLRPELLEAVYGTLKFKKPSKIQGLAIKSILENPPHNFIGQAQSGTGKTGAFALSMLARVDENEFFPQALCVAPTRELVRQIFDVTVKLAEKTKIKVLLDVPEEKFSSRITQQVVVGTPGRIYSSIDKGRLSTKGLKIFVLDEADEMLMLQGQQSQTLKIHKRIPPHCQICLFSATYSEDVKIFSHSIVRDPKVSVFIEPDKLSLDQLIQTFVECGNEQQKFRVLSDIFGFVNVGQSIIFTHTREKAKEVFRYMKASGHEVSLLHGDDMSVQLRDKTIDDFRNGKNRVLITTNLLARGVDVLQVSLVINFDLPMLRSGNPDPDTYLHRIGRTARYNNPGLAINFVHDYKSRMILNMFEEIFHRKIEEIPINSLETIGEKLDKMAVYTKILPKQ